MINSLNNKPIQIKLNYNTIKVNPTDSLYRSLYRDDQIKDYLAGDSAAERSLKLKGYVGFDKIASQHCTKAVKGGFAFNILCIGETGIGKSTLMDTLFNTSFHLKSSTHHEDKVQLIKSTVDLYESNVHLKLTIVETSGFGDQINKENSYEPIAKYIDDQFEAYAQEELNLNRNIKQINDTRIHVCLYFICPTGHTLKTLDLETIKALDHKINIIPVIAKADTVSKNELLEFKKRIMSDLISNNINIYQFPINDYDLSISTANANANALYPFALIGSSDLVKIGNKFARGRHYEWGTVSVENENHCDFIKLREMLLSTNLIDLIEQTHVKHYQTYRAYRLREMGFNDPEDFSDNEDSTNLPKSITELFAYKVKMFNQEKEMKEIEIKEDFVRRVKEKENELKESERELNSRYTKLKKEHSEWSERIEAKRHELETEIRDFSERKFTLERSKQSTLLSTAGGKSSKKR